MEITIPTANPRESGSAFMPELRVALEQIRARIDAISGEVFNVQEYGAEGDGSTVDTATIQSAISTGGEGATIFFPEGTYIIGVGGLFGYSNQTWKGIPGKTILKYLSTPNGPMVFFGSKSNFKLEDLVFDSNNKIPVGNNAVIEMQACSDFVVRRCKIKHIERFGMAASGPTNFIIEECDFEKDAIDNTTLNAALNVSHIGTSFIASNGVIEDNKMTNCEMGLAGNLLTIEGNRINGFGSGGGIVLEQDDDTHTNQILNNFVTGGFGVDVNGTRCPGIENWGRDTLIEGNTVWGNSGVGLDCGGKNCIVANNTIFDNGQSLASPGISLRYGDATYNASGTLLIGNRVWGATTQTYGLSFQNSSITGVRLGEGNDFTGNRDGDVILNNATIINKVYGAFGVGGSPLLGAHLSVDKSLNGEEGLYLRNVNAGASAFAALRILNGTNVDDGVYMLATGTGFTSSGAFKQDCGAIGSNAGLSGGLSVVAGASDLRIYTGGIADANLRLTVLSGGGFSFANSSQLQSANYASQTTGWAISGDGAADVRHLYTDSLQAKSFILDLEQALAGGQIISKSVAEVATDFTLPAAGGVGTLTVNDLPSAPNMAVFQSGDMVRLRQFSRASGVLTIADAWGVVTAYVDNAGGTQSWTFTRSTGAQAGTATGTINAKTLALDYGTSGNGIYEVNAIDGAYGVNAPYWQIKTWATHPQNGQTVRVRGGNLKGITGVMEYGLYAGDGSVTDANRYLRITDQNFELKNLGLKIYQGADLAISLEPTIPYFALGNPMPTSYLQNSTSGIWMGHTGSSVYKLRIGTTNGSGVLTAGLTWDGTVLNVIGGGTFSGALSAATGTFAGSLSAATGTFAGSLSAATGSFSGTVTATAGAIGGFVVGTDYIRDTANSFGLASAITGSDGVRFWAGDTFANRSAAPFRLTEAGALVAGGGNVTLNSNGISVLAGIDAYLAGSSYKHVNGSGTVISDFWAQSDTTFGINSATIQISSMAGQASFLNLITKAPSGKQSQVVLASYVNNIFQTGINVTESFVQISGGSVSGANILGPGLCVGANATPNAMLDVRGTGVFTGQLTLSGGLVLGTELFGLVPATHLMQLNAGTGVDPLMMSGGTGCVQIWKDTSASKAASFGLAIPGVAIGDDLDFGTFNGTTWSRRLRLSNAGSIIIGTAALATTATDGFLYVPTCAGAPTGTPTTHTGRAPHVVDTTNGRAYWYYGGAWHYAALT